MAMPSHKNPCSRGNEIYDFLYILSLTDLYPGVEKKCIKFTLFTPKLSPLEMGVFKYTFSWLLTLATTYATNKFG